MNDTGSTPVKATATSVRILETLRASGPAPLTEIATELPLSKSSVHNHLTTLERLGLVVKTDMTYRVSLRFLEIGAAVRPQFPCYAVGKREVRRLANASGLAAGLVVLEGDTAICLYATPGQGAEPVPVEAGETVPLHASAAGKAILAELPESELDSRLDDVGFAALTDATLTSAADLRDQLETVRTRGVAAEREEWQADMRGLAAGFSDGEHTRGSIYVLSRSESLSGKQFQQDVPGLLSSAATGIRQELRND